MYIYNPFVKWTDKVNLTEMHVLVITLKTKYTNMALSADTLGKYKHISEQGLTIISCWSLHEIPVYAI